MDLSGKACLVTGGTSGIGAATALALARHGAQVAVMGRTIRNEAFTRLKQASGARDEQWAFIQADAAKADDCVRAVAETQSAFGSVDVLIHAAGGAFPGGLFEITEERWRDAFDVHVHAIVSLARAAAPHMMKRGEGAMILIGSAAGQRGCLGAIAYGVVKGALPQLARTLARELADYNIRINCVSPGIIRTPFQDSLTPEQVRNNIENRIPLHREGKPEDVAKAIVALIENDFITGENLVIDGGMTMRIA